MHLFKRIPFLFIAASLVFSGSSHALGLPDQDPYVAWARQAYAGGRVPLAADLLPGQIWSCTLAFSMEDLFYYETVPSFQFKIEGNRVKNGLLLSQHRENRRREYDFFYQSTAGEKNLARDLMLDWAISVGSNWANPEVGTPFKMFDSIRSAQGGRLIVQRSVTGNDLARLSSTYNAHQKVLGRTTHGYGMPEAIPNFGQSVPSDLNKRQYAFQYFVCDRPTGNLPSKGNEQEPPQATAPATPAAILPLADGEFIDSDGLRKRCPFGTTPVQNRIINFLTETSATATLWVGEGWFSKIGDSVEFDEKHAREFNSMDTLRDSEGHAITVVAGHPYQFKAKKAQTTCHSK